MKKLVLLLLFYSSLTQAQSDVSIERSVSLCKAWGLVKYFHSETANKTIDWDQKFISQYEDLQNARKSVDYQLELGKLLERGGVYARPFSAEDSLKIFFIQQGKLSRLLNFNDLTDSSKYLHQPDFSWIEKGSNFSAENKHLLYQVLIDYQPKKSAYIKGRFGLSHKENPFTDIDSVTEAYRLLALYRYWNIVEYFYPYKQLGDTTWDAVLREMIPVFEQPCSYLGYVNLVKKLSARLSDPVASKTEIDPKEGMQPENKQGLLYPPVQLKALNDSTLLITQVMDSALAAQGTLRIGDQVLEINTDDLQYELADLRKIISCSTEASFLGQAPAFLLQHFGSNKPFSMTVRRGKERLSFTDLLGVPLQAKSKKIIRGHYVIKETIGYFNPAALTVGELRKAMNQCRELPALIFDLRTIPRNNTPYFLARIFSSQPLPAAAIESPSSKYPGVLVQGKAETYYNENIPAYLLKKMTGLRTKVSPTTAPLYTGKVIVLIDEGTAGLAETTALILKAYVKKITFVGTASQGASAEQRSFLLPGGVRVYLSAIDRQLPDGTVLQRKGLVPQVLIAPTAAGMAAGKDEILEKAISYIQTQP